MSLKPLSLELIRIDGGTQSRVKIDEDHVAELTDAWRAKAEVPPSVVFFDGTEYWLAEGFHRFLAAQRAKRASLPCDIRKGTLRDAILFSVGANQGHGLKRTNADKKKSVITLLNDAEWLQWSSHRIAEQAGVGHTFVDELRNQLASDAGSNSESSGNSTISTPEAPDETRIGRDGKRRPAKPKKADPEKVAEREKAKAEKARLKSERKAQREADKLAKVKAKADAKAAREEARNADSVRRNGKATIKQTIDDKEVVKAFGAVVRLIDLQANACGLNNSPGHREATATLNKALEAYHSFTTDCRSVIARK